MVWIDFICQIDWSLNLLALLSLVGFSIVSGLQARALKIGKAIGIRYSVIKFCFMIFTALILILNLLRIC